MESTQLPTVESPAKDQWELALGQKLEALRQCQQEHALKSCLSCPEIFDCPQRDAYVKAVYESMSKGHGGGFEF